MASVYSKTSCSSSTVLQWLSLVAVIWLQSFNGTNTNFPSYSSELKQLLSISQLQLNNLAFASDAGKLFGFFPGVASVYLPLWVVLLIGSTLGLIGYGLQYLFLIHQLSSLSYWQVFALTVVGGNSICWINTVCYIVVVRNFPLQQLQVAVGLSTSYVGLSAMIYTAFVDEIVALLSQYGTKSDHNIASEYRRSTYYLVLNATLPLVVSIITAPLIIKCRCSSTSTSTTGGVDCSNADDDYAKKRKATGLIVLLMITISTGLYAIISRTLDSSSSRRKLLPPLVNMVGVGTCLALPLLVPLGEYCFKGKLLINSSTTSRTTSSSTSSRVCDESNITTCAEYDDEVIDQRRAAAPSVLKLGFDHDCIASSTSDHLQLGRDDRHHEEEEIMTSKVVVVAVMEEIGAKLMVKRLNFWLYFLVYLMGATVGLVYLNNLGQIVESRSADGSNNTSSAQLVSLSSAFGFFGRLLPCLFHYNCSRLGCIVPGPASIVAFMVPLSAAFFLLASNITSSLYVSTAIIGACTGAITTVSVSLTTQLFGTKNFGVNHNLVVANITIGSFLFGDLAALLYRRRADQATGICIGIDCFRDTFIVWGSLCSCGTLLALILHFRTRNFYYSNSVVQRSTATTY